MTDPRASTDEDQGGVAIDSDPDTTAKLDPHSNGQARQGRLLPTRWLVALFFVWGLATGVFIAIWVASVELLGHHTVWLGPPTDPTPFYVRLLPFVGFVAMLMAILAEGRNDSRWVLMLGVFVSIGLIALGWIDLDYYRGFGQVEMATGVLTLLGTLAGFPRLQAPAHQPDR